MADSLLIEEEKKCCVWRVKKRRSSILKKSETEIEGKCQEIEHQNQDTKPQMRRSKRVSFAGQKQVIEIATVSEINRNWTDSAYSSDDVTSELRNIKDLVSMSSRESANDQTTTTGSVACDTGMTLPHMPCVPGRRKFETEDIHDVKDVEVLSTLDVIRSLKYNELEYHCGTDSYSYVKLPLYSGISKNSTIASVKDNTSCGEQDICVNGEAYTPSSSHHCESGDIFNLGKPWKNSSAMCGQNCNDDMDLTCTQEYDNGTKVVKSPLKQSISSSLTMSESSIHHACQTGKVNEEGKISLVYAAGSSKNLDYSSNHMLKCEESFDAIKDDRPSIEDSTDLACAHPFQSKGALDFSIDARSKVENAVEFTCGVPLQTKNVLDSDSSFAFQPGYPMDITCTLPLQTKDTTNFTCVITSHSEDAMDFTCAIPAQAKDVSGQFIANASLNVDAMDITCAMLQQTKGADALQIKDVNDFTFAVGQVKAVSSASSNVVPPRLEKGSNDLFKITCLDEDKENMTSPLISSIPAKETDSELASTLRDARYAEPESPKKIADVCDAFLNMVDNSMTNDLKSWFLPLLDQLKWGTCKSKNFELNDILGSVALAQTVSDEDSSSLYEIMFGQKIEMLFWFSRQIVVRESALKQIESLVTWSVGNIRNFFVNNSTSASWQIQAFKKVSVQHKVCQLGVIQLIQHCNTLGKVMWKRAIGKLYKGLCSELKDYTDDIVAEAKCFLFLEETEVCPFGKIMEEKLMKAKSCPTTKQQREMEILNLKQIELTAGLKQQKERLETLLSIEVSLLALRVNLLKGNLIESKTV